MSDGVGTFDPIWEELRKEGKSICRYPFDVAVSFLFKHAPGNKQRGQVRVLEIGCGAGNNLWFAAREGFQVTGIDGSATAIRYAQNRFKEEGLRGDFHIGCLTCLPFHECSFDLALDRASLTCCGASAAKQAVREIRRVLVPGGKFLCNPYGDSHSSRSSGTIGRDGLTLNISAGTLVGFGQICFYSKKDVDKLFEGGWEMLSVQLNEITEFTAPGSIHTEWRIIAQKKG